jgi:hypothetical protein
MRLESIQEHLKNKGVAYRYFEEDGCGTIEFIHRGLAYHIWEYPDGEGADSNVLSAGRMESYTGDYEAKILEILKTW